MHDRIAGRRPDFLTESVHVEAIREDQEYGAMRVKLMAMLGNVRIPLQVDVGAGDAVVPPPEVLDYPGLLDLPRARLRAYRPETSIAEKTEAMVRLALANSRMKDFFDIHRLAATRTFDGETMRLAVAATFARRGIEMLSQAAAAEALAVRLPSLSALRHYRLAGFSLERLIRLNSASPSSGTPNTVACRTFAFTDPPISPSFQ
jgi:Nucleotidyl transferase AbiEii toxin, Type IV TA system